MGFTTKLPSLSANSALPISFSSSVSVLGLRSYKSDLSYPAAIAALRAASVSVNVRLLLPATAFQPGIVPPLRIVPRAYSSRSLYHLTSSWPLISRSPISSSVRVPCPKRGGSSPFSGTQSLNSSRAVLMSARALHFALPRQKRQCSPGLNSPSPIYALAAAGLMLSPQASSSSTVMVSLLGSVWMRG